MTRKSLARRQRDLQLYTGNTPNNTYALMQENRQLRQALERARGYPDFAEKLSALENLLHYTAGAAFSEGQMLEIAMKGVAGQLTGALMELTIEVHAMGDDLAANDPDGLIQLVARVCNGIKRILNHKDNGEALRSVIGERPGKFGKLAKTRALMDRGGRDADKGKAWLKEHARKRKEDEDLEWTELADRYLKEWEADPPQEKTVEHDAWQWLKDQTPGRRGRRLSQAVNNHDTKPVS